MKFIFKLATVVIYSVEVYPSKIQTIKKQKKKRQSPGEDEACYS